MSGESLLEPMDTDKAGASGGEPNENEEIIRKFRKEAAKSFFDEYGLISHQINSYNDFITCGIQNMFDSLGEVTVEPNYDPNKKGEGGWRYATITYGKVSLEAPIFWTSKGDGDEELRLMPRHARLQHMSYSSRMRVEVKVQVYTYESSKTDKYKTSSEHKIINKKILSDETKEIIVGRIPVMVKSKLCWLHELDKSDCLFDCGGYFVIKGAEKTFIAQEKLCLTRLWINSKPWTASYWALTKKERIFVKLGDGSKMENIDEGKVLNVFFLYASVPVWILFFALGVSSDKEIFQMIDIETCDADVVNILLATISSADTVCEGFRQGGKALQHIGEAIKKTKFPPSENVEECITKYLFPMIHGHKQKALFLGYMVKSLLLALLGKRKVDNKDDFRNKRLALAGDLLARELQGHIRHAERLMVRSMQKDLCGDRELQFIERYFDASIITNGLNRAFSTGVWFHPSKRTEKCTGVVATLRRTNPLQMLSDLRKTRQQVAYTGKVGDARYPNPSYWGKVCFLSTPDGENCGLVKNLAITGIVSSDFVAAGSSVTQFKVSSSKAGSSKVGSSKTGLTTDSNSREAIIKKLVTFCGMELLESIPLDDLSKMDKVFLNGDWVGSCRNPSSFATNLRSIRRKRLINQQVEIKREEHQKEIRIFSDSGRIMRPLLIVENLSKIKSLKGWSSFQSLLDEQIIEFIGTEEEEDCIIAWSPKDLFDDKGKSAKPHTHCELDLSFLLGLSCSIIPFANHNFARRVLFQSEKHSQQAIGYSTTNPHIRIDTLSHQMYYPQKPLFRSIVADCISSSEASSGKHTLPRPEIFNGQNAIVAVNVHQGYNQEDSLVMNKTSLERGMFRTEHFKNYKSEVDNKELQTSKHLKPKDMVSFGRMESRVGRIDSLDEDGFPFIGASLQTGDIIIGKVAESGVDNCVKLKHTEKGMVQKVVLSSNDEGKNFAAVTLRQVRSPCVGDKFSSMHGQKGVIGFLESQENFPFTIQGIVPDIVINPHAFPTRQTPGQLLEASLGKGICCGGLTKYSTPFTTPSFDVITDQLHRAGYSRWGGERVCNGRTGEMMRSLIFMGPTFYQRLHHMAEDKMKFRNTGPVHPLTRQPVSDRKRFGGVKFGEMERDCLLAHGAAANLHERLFTLSDFSHMHVCRSCRRAANVILRPLPGGKKIRGPYCQFCKSAENIVKVDVPYGAKLLYQELFSMGICLTFNTEIC